MYKFSAPMPYSIEDINKLLDINNQVEKSAITSLYACLPSTCELFTGFEQPRNFTVSHNDWDYWKNLIKHTLNKGCDFIYLLNSPRPLDIDTPEFPKSLEKLENLLTELKKIGVNKLRVASFSLLNYLEEYHSNFNILASTSLEYKTIWEYQNFIYFHPEVKQIVPSHDVNKNFKLLSILRHRYPNIDIELIVNEGCLQGCPNRMYHTLLKSTNKYIDTNNIRCFLPENAIYNCNQIINKYPIQSLVIGTNIFPWDIEQYKKIQITNFKFVGRDEYINFNRYKNIFFMYLKGIDDIKNVEECNFGMFAHHLYGQFPLNKLKVKDYKKYFPNIKHFTKYGHLCASRCGVECRYCYKCAEKIQKEFQRKQAQVKKIIQPCYIN